MDVAKNAPGHPVDAFRAEHGLADDQTTAVPGRILNVGVVCRLVPELKLEGILTAIDAIASSYGRPKDPHLASILPDWERSKEHAHLAVWTWCRIATPTTRPS